MFTGAYFLFKHYKRTRRVTQDEEKAASTIKSKKMRNVDSDDDSLYTEECQKGHDRAEPPPELGPHPSETIEAARARKSWRWSWRKSGRGSLDFTVKDEKYPGQEQLPRLRESKKQQEHRGSMLSVTTIQNQHTGEDRASQYDLAIEIVNERGSPTDNERSSIAIMRLDIEPRPMSSTSRPPSRLR